jgi:hypothetical protein
MTQYADVSPIEPKGILSKWRNDRGVVARKNARSSGHRMMFKIHARNIMGIHQRILQFPF